MSICTFFGHRDAPEHLMHQIETEITRLIIEKNVTMFYVGDSGKFDHMVRKMLRSLTQKYTNVKYAVIPAYMPCKKYQSTADNSDTLCPYVFQGTPPKFAIEKRNRWMLENSDYVVTYVTHNFGGAAKFKEIAEKKGKTVINIPSVFAE